MDKLPEVESAKALMTEAMTWSVVRWLREKKRVRKAADLANAALDRSSEAVRERWPDRMRAAYEALAMQATGGPTARSQQKPPLTAIDQEASVVAGKSKKIDDEAYRTRMDAEETFDQAERRLSTLLAREGCRKAIHSWDLHEQAIRKAESLVRSK